MQLKIINTGGTFNKYYNPIKGSLEVSKDDAALKPLLANCFNVRYSIANIIAKDSLDFQDIDRQSILENIKNSQEQKIIIIHGTDTIDKTAEFLATKVIEKRQIILTGAMTPASIDKIEAGFNLALAIGFLNANPSNGIYIAMHGAVAPHHQIKKDIKKGQFLLI